MFSLHSSGPHLVATRLGGGGESWSEGSVVLGPPVRMSPYMYIVHKTCKNNHAGLLRGR